MILSQDFDSGALDVAATVVESSDGSMTVRLAPRRNWQGNLYGWVFFCMQGVEGLHPRFRIPAGDSFLPLSEHHRYCFSTDERRWHYFDHAWLDADGKPSVGMYRSTDEGNSWHEAAAPVPAMGERGSNPPALVRTASGRLALVYGYRNPPYGMRAVVSDDDGDTWSEPIVLRDDGGDGDLGYPRAVLRADGKLVTCYYYNEHTDGERFIAATIWDIDTAEVNRK